MPSQRRLARELSGSDFLVPLGVAVLYVGAARLGLSLAYQAEQVSAVWPPAGLALAAVFWFGRRAVPGVLLGAFVANAMAAEPLWVAAGIAVGNTLEAVVGSALLSRLRFEAKLARPRDVLSLLAAAAASAAVAATIGVACLVGGGVQARASFPALWLVWWVGDALGELVFAPLAFVVLTRSRLAFRRRIYFEGPLLLAGLFAVSVFVFAPKLPATDLKYLVFPFLIWAAVRFGPAATVAVIVLTYGVAVWATHRGIGPFAGVGPERGLVPLALFMGVVATTGLLLGAIAAQRREAEEELRRRAEQLSETDRRKDEFLAMLSHELRNPLAPILHAVEMLEHRDPELAAQARRIIRRQSTHLTRLVDDLLDVSRITRGTVRLERQRIPLKEVLDSGVDVWRHRIAERGQKLSVETPSETVWLDGDPTRLAQVVSNLLHNATDYTPEGGQIAITADVENGWTILRVRDTGRGMSPEDLDRAFDLFARGPQLSRDSSQGGLGLGLTLARRLVELHGGRVAATSHGLGRGSEFVVRLPVAEAPPEAERETAQPVAPLEPVRVPGAGRRVLVVDDNDDAREALRFLLEDDGHEVRTAGDGPTAIAEAERFRPDVVLLDIGLPGIDGYEVARALRGLPQSRTAQIVAVSGYGQAEDRARSREAGFDLHMLKPVEPAKLLDLVRTV